MSNYHPEPYWSDVAKRIDARSGDNIIAGDDEPYYRYKKKRFLDMLMSIDFSGQKVLEIGSGPGGNLKAIDEKGQYDLLMGVDISDEMIKVAKKRVPGVEIIKINGTELPFENHSFDYVFTATVLQHNTDDKMMKSLLKEICRVSAKKVFLFERIENEIKGDALCLGRPVRYYEDICKEAGFMLSGKEFINIRSSYYISGLIRKLFNPSSRKEGEPLSSVSIILQKMTLPFTKLLDKIFKSKKDVAKLEFVRVN
ncbi:MAG: class I SAM-dependent methyltransferase [Bacteroidia bacterium]|nr:class I SAM-dependent methyltransferase [Bacteroidia bacterium]